MSHTRSFFKLIRTALIIFGVMLLSLMLFACGNKTADIDDGDNVEGNGSGTTQSHGHSLVHYYAAEPTCLLPGSTEFWQCSKCGLKFSDADASSRVETTEIPIVDHNYGYGWNDISHYSVCTVCGVVLEGTSTAHVKRYAADRTSHYQYCECGWKSRPSRHNIVGGKPCTDCGYGGLVYELSSNGDYYICIGASDASKATVAAYIIPDEYNGLQVKAIGARAFDSCSALEKITLGKNIETISEYAFKGCNKLTEISLNDGLAEIKASAFTDCHSLKAIEIPETVTNIGGSVFRGCTSLKTINIPKGVKELPERVFFNCIALESLSFPSVETIGTAVFSRSGLKTLTVPETVTAIPQTMAESCSSLETVNIPASVKSIGIGAFMNCKKLATLNYAGTEQEWTLVTLGNMWNRNANLMKVVCMESPEGL